MTPRLKVNSIMAVALGAAFYAFFMFTKHDPVLSSIIPFDNDPYDSVGSFAVVISALLVILSLFRAFRPYPSVPSSARLPVFLPRTHMAIALAVLITLAADVIAMARHVSMWSGVEGTGELVALVLGMATISVAFGVTVRRGVGDLGLPMMPTGWLKVSATCLAFVVALALYPEGIIRSTAGELFSLAVGIVLLFVPMSVLTEALVPYDTEGAAAGRASGVGRSSRRWVQWLAAALVGVAIGVALLLGETSGDHGRGVGIPATQRLMVVSVFIGAATAGVLAAYYSLRRPLGLFADDSSA